MSEFQKLLSTVRSALERGAERDRPAPDEAAAGVPVSPAARRAECGFRFVRELEAVSGQAFEVSSAAEAIEKTVELARKLGARALVAAEPLSAELAGLETELERQGFEVIRVGPVGNSGRADLRTRIARCELGVLEADYAIAASGTLALRATATRPRSASLLPPANIVIVHIDRVVPDLAAFLRTLGPERAGADPLVLITGPSRTADIEKRIVLGVHGPKELYVIVIWPKGE